MAAPKLRNWSSAWLTLEILLGRLLKHLAAMGSIYETGPNEYVPTPFSKALKEPIYRDAYPFMFIPCFLFYQVNFSGADHHDRFEACGPSFLALPEHLSKVHYKNPDDPVNGSFQLGHDTKDGCFEWLMQRPELLSQFQNHMAGRRRGQPSWMDPGFYPVNETLVNGAKVEDVAVFLVDIGGGKGHDLQELHRKHPKLPGKLVLQDLKSVIEEAKRSGLDERIEPMEYDFFTKQPIRGISKVTKGSSIR